MNSKQTATRIASQASRVLADSTSSSVAKSLAASALAQRSSSSQTGARIEDIASRVLDSSKYSAATKALAGSVLSQSNKGR